MALTITNHLVRSADAPHTAGFGDVAGIVIRLPGGVLTGGPGRRRRGRRGGQPDPGRLQRRCTTKGSGPAWTPGAAGSAVPDPLALCRHPWCPGPGDGLARGW
jgi:hypothetical protein